MNAHLKGKGFEQLVGRMIRSKLGAKVVRDRQSGAGVNKSDISDYYQNLPLSIECKDQETIKIKEWFRQAVHATSGARVPAVVFHADSEILCTLRFTDMLNFLVEINDQAIEIKDMRKPVNMPPPKLRQKLQTPIDKQTVILDQNSPEDLRKGRTVYLCNNNHVADQYGYCQTLGCQHSRGYRKPKAKRGK